MATLFVVTCCACRGQHHLAACAGSMREGDRAFCMAMWPLSICTPMHCQCSFAVKEKWNAAAPGGLSHDSSPQRQSAGLHADDAPAHRRFRDDG